MFQACADKLKREMEEFGNPPDFPADDEKPEEQDDDKSNDPVIKDKAKGKKVRVSAVRQNSSFE